MAAGEYVEDDDCDQGKDGGCAGLWEGQEDYGAEAKEGEPETGKQKERSTETEDGVEIFRHDADDAHGSGGPVEGDHAGSDDYSLAEAGLLDAAGEGEVFEDLHVEGVEAAELLVGGGAKEVEGSYADGVADGFGVGGSPGAGGPEAHDLEVAKEHSFAGGFDEGGREGDEVVGLGCYSVGQGSADDFAVEDDVGVSK